MKKFSELGIMTESKGFVGDKIKAKKILNKTITVHSWEIKPSKYTGDCLYLQIELDGTKHVVFSSSKVLMDTIKKIPATDFPFETTIIENNERHEFS